MDSTHNNSENNCQNWVELNNMGPSNRARALLGLMPRFLVRFLGMWYEFLLQQLNLVKYLISVVMHHRNRVLFIHLPVLNQLEPKNIILIKNYLKLFKSS